MLNLSKEQINTILGLYNNDQFQEAIDAIELLNLDYPNDPVLFNISGACYDELGQFDNAAKSYNNAITIQPEYAKAHFNLGGTLQDLGKPDEAVKSYKNALAIESNYAEAHNNLGNVFRELNQIEGSIRSYQSAIAINPKYVDAFYNLGNIYQSIGELDLAIENYKEVLLIKPDFAEMHNNLAVLLIENNQLDAALKHLENAIKIRQDFPEAHNNLGNIFLETNKLLEAIREYEKALSINSNYAEAYYNLSNISRYTMNSEKISDMHSILTKNDLIQSDRIHLCFALANVNENLGLQDNYFRFLNEANYLQKKELNYSIEKDKNLFLNIKSFFSSPIECLFDTPRVSPIFIIGMPRSGTSLVEQIISSHHKVYGGGELAKFPDLIEPLIKDYFEKDITCNKESMFLSIRQEYSEYLANFNVAENIITDKLPLNFEYVGFILSAFPEAKIIHLNRDARATCWSNYKCFFINRSNEFAYSFDDIVGFYTLYKDLMKFWHELYPNKIYDISYEDLTTNQEEETRKLLEYCDLEWDEDCLNFHTNERAVQTASSLQVREKMYQGSSEAWKNYKDYLKPIIK